MPAPRTFVVVGRLACRRHGGGDAPRGGVRRPDRADRRERACPTNGPPCRRSTCAARSPSTRSWCGRPSGGKHDIEARLGVHARSLDARERTVVLAGGERMAFDGRSWPRAAQPHVGRSRRGPSAASRPPHVGDADAIRERRSVRGARRRGHGVHRGGGRRLAPPTGARRHRHRDLRDRAVTASSAPTSAACSRRSIATTAWTMHFNDSVARFEGDGRLERVVTRTAGPSRPIRGRRRGDASRPRSSMAGVDRGQRRHPVGPPRWRRRSPASSPPATSHATSTRCSAMSGGALRQRDEDGGARRTQRCSAPPGFSTTRTGSGRTSTSSRSRWPGSPRPARWSCGARSRLARSRRSSSTTGVLRACVSIAWPRDFRRSCA